MVTLIPVGGTARPVIGFVPAHPVFERGGAVRPGKGITIIKKQPIQLVGLTPLYDCTIDDCRVNNVDTEIKNRVFGNFASPGVPESSASYKNDFTPILVDMKAYAANIATVSVSFLLQTIDSLGTWSTVATMTGTTYGIPFALGYFKYHLNYTGYGVNWAKVLFLHGPGTYRIKVTSAFQNVSGCLVTDCFELREFDCDLAHGTVKIETWLSGKIGDPYTDYFLHDLCNMEWYDSFRYNGFFGKKEIPEYREINTEWGAPFHGKIEKVKDEAVPVHTLHTNYMKQVYHDRLSVFGLMSDRMWISDYNINNSDYNLKRVLMLKDDNYSPVYQDDLWNRNSKVSVKFKRGVQSIIKSNCCIRSDA